MKIIIHVHVDLKMQDVLLWNIKDDILKNAGNQHWRLLYEKKNSFLKKKILLIPQKKERNNEQTMT